MGKHWLFEDLSNPIVPPEGVRIELVVPKALLEKFDKNIKEHFANRSEAVRAAMRLLIQKLETKQLV